MGKILLLLLQIFKNKLKPIYIILRYIILFILNKKYYLIYFIYKLLIIDNNCLNKINC